MNKIAGVKAPDYRTLFEQCQPWRNPDGHDKDALWMLHEFDRIDKHRVVTPVFMVALKATGQVRVTYPSDEAAKHADATPPMLKSPPQAPVKDGAEVFRITTASPFVGVEMNSEIILGVSLQYGDRPYRGGVRFLLNEMAKRARGIAEQFRDAGL